MLFLKQAPGMSLQEFFACEQGLGHFCFGWFYLLFFNLFLYYMIQDLVFGGHKNGMLLINIYKFI